jgi:hypothetical protein
MALVGRTPLLLAFGEHPAECGGIRYGADKRFFKSAIVPFLEEHVEKRGVKAAIILEFNMGFDLQGYDRLNPAHAKAVHDLVAQTGKGMEDAVSPGLDAGNGIGANAYWFDWGFLDKVIAINSGIPGRVHSIVEPLMSDIVWNMWDQTLVSYAMRKAGTFEERVEIEKEVIKYSARTCIQRSRRVAELAKRMRAEEPQGAVIIPRGYAHSGMAAFFSQEEFDITCVSHMRGGPRFSSDIIIEAFNRDVGEDEWRRHAALSLRFSSYALANGERFLREACKDGSYNEDALRMLSVEARRHALDLEARGELYSGGKTADMGHAADI